MKNDLNDQTNRTVVTGESDGGLLASVGGWLSGIPKVFHRPLAKAAGRLLLGLVKGTTASLNSKAQDIARQQAVRERVRSALSKQTIAGIAMNHDIGERALEYFAADIIGKQENREAVVQYAVSQLSSITDSVEPSSEQQATSATQKEPTLTNLDDDWLNDFAQCAENASTERMRKLFGRVLAGEIRQPGTYSLFTLDFLSKLSASDEAMIVSIAPFVVGRSIPLTKTVESAITFDTMLRLVDIGILTAASVGRQFNRLQMKFALLAINKTMGKFTNTEKASNRTIVFAASTNVTVSYDCVILTRVALEILALYSSEPDRNMLGGHASLLQKQNAEVYITAVPTIPGAIAQVPLLRVATLQETNDTRT